MQRRRHSWKATAYTAAVLLTCDMACSQPARAESAASGWQFYFTPYTWISGTSGSTHFSNPHIPNQTTNIGFGETLKHLNSIPIVGSMEFQRGRFGILTDLTVASLSGNASTTTRLFNGVSYSFTQLIATVLPTYRLFGTPTQSLDVGIGARIVAVWSGITLNAGLLPEVSTHTSEVWADPIFGIGYRVHFSPRYSFTGYGDVGATGATSTWQLMGTVNYQATSWLKLSMGYRYLDIDYRNTSINSDTALSGPLLGATIHF